jgi:hypothetical protein
MAVSENSLRFALRNVAQHGDTDVFPYPLENHWFHDSEDAAVKLLLDIDAHFEDWLGRFPVGFATNLSSVGYNGFRAATQIEPIWNAYLLGLVVEIAPNIEAARIPVSKEIVFSYRFSPSNDRFTLFDPEYGWARFHKAGLDRVNRFEFVVSTDISDFYPRVYHHRLENALKSATTNTEVVRRIMTILGRISNGPSYGLPVGGNAARLLAELLLNRTDALLLNSAKVQFCRFVDDYHLFAVSASQAQSYLVQLSEILLTNEGLTLARAKTRVLSKAEYARNSPFSGAGEADSADEGMAREFLGLRLAYDPYSPTADERYEKLREELEKFDITGMLARELRKSRIDESLTRQLVKSVRFLSEELRNAAVTSIIRNLGTLYPIFPTVAIMLRQLLGDLTEETRSEIFSTIRSLIAERSHIMIVPANLSFSIRLLAHDRDEQTDALLIDVYSTSKDMMVRRDVLLAMARRGVDYWLSPQLKTFATVTPWERRALLVASYALGDEGKHWRNATVQQLHDIDKAFVQWLSEKNNGRQWEVPL